MTTPDTPKDDASPTPEPGEASASPEEERSEPWSRSTRDRYRREERKGDESAAEARSDVSGGALRLQRGGLATTGAVLWGAWALMSCGWFTMVLLGIDAVRFGRHDPRLVAGAIAGAAVYAFVRALLDRGRVRVEGRYLIAERAPLAPRSTVLIPFRQLIRLSAKPLQPGPLDRLRAGGRESLSMPWSVEARLRDGSRAALPFRLPPDEARRLMHDIHALARSQGQSAGERGGGSRPDDWV